MQKEVTMKTLTTLVFSYPYGDISYSCDNEKLIKNVYVEAFLTIYDRVFKSGVSDWLKDYNEKLENTKESYEKALYIQNALIEECGEKKLYLQNHINVVVEKLRHSLEDLKLQNKKLEAVQKCFESRDIDDIYYFMKAYYPPRVMETQIFE